MIQKPIIKSKCKKACSRLFALRREILAFSLLSLHIRIFMECTIRTRTLDLIRKPSAESVMFSSVPESDTALRLCLGQAAERE